jgi:hypothetical protein
MDVFSDSIDRIKKIKSLVKDGNYSLAEGLLDKVITDLSNLRKKI